MWTTLGASLTRKQHAEKAAYHAEDPVEELCTSCLYSYVI